MGARKPVGVTEDNGSLCVICDDGSVWKPNLNGEWRAAPPVPGTEAARALEDRAPERFGRAVEAFRAACYLSLPADGDSGLSRLDWLHALLAEADRAWTEGRLGTEDPEAFGVCLHACRKLHDHLRVAMAQAEGRG